MSNVQKMKFSDICKFTDKQWEATRASDKYKYVLFGGARGPGKSYWLRYSLLRFLLKWAAEGHENVRVMLACEDYPSLYERQVSKIEAEFPLWLGRFWSKRNEFRIHKEFGGGVIALRNLDDPLKYQSAEYAAIAVDELTKNPESTFHALRGSLRWPGIRDTRFIAATNPEPGWVRSYWIEGNFPERMDSEAEKFFFVPALATDNPYLDEEYWNTLDTLPDNRLRKAWRYGDWYAGLEGLVFDTFGSENLTDEWVTEPFDFEIAIDDGYIDPRATLFIQRKPGGDVLVFHEFYERKVLEEATVQRIIDFCHESGLPLPSKAIVSHEAVSLRKRLALAGIPSVNWMSRKAGSMMSTREQAVMLTQALILDSQGYRALRVNKKCKNLIAEITGGYRYARGGESEKKAQGNDHACDALTSWVWYNDNRPRDVVVRSAPRQITNYTGL